MDQKQQKSRKIQFTVSWKSLAVILILILVGLICYTKPWSSKSDTTRTITVSGEATVKRTPDLFIYYPFYEESSQTAIVAKTNEVVKKLKELGLGDAGIQTSVSNYEKYDQTGPTGEQTYSASMTLTVDNKDVAQKVQDYLIESGASGSVTPSYEFTRETKKQLKDEATVIAIEDAKARAEKQAQSLGAKLGQVVGVTEPENFDIYPVAAFDSAALEAGDVESLPIQAGENEFTYSVKVEFEIK